MINQVTVYACAKINLYLGVGGRRDDGYHNIETVLQSVSLYDTVKLAQQHSGIKFACTDRSLAVPDNLAIKAARLFFEDSHIDGGVDIKLKKTIPVAAGLAGGSSDAAAVLVGLNLLYRAGYDEAELCRLGEAIGMDVPFCICGGAQLGTGRGEKLSPVPSMPKCRILIAVGNDRIGTGEAYAKLDILPQETPDASAMAEALSSGDLDAVCAAMYNRFEQATNLHDEAKGIMLAHGAVGAMMSGSGPSVFGIFRSDEPDKLFEARTELAAKKYTTVVCEPME